MAPTPVVGLLRERQVLTVALRTGRHVVLEGPPGTGKSTLLRSIAADTGQEVVFVEGNAELTPARLVGQFDPSQVLASGYQVDAFVDGPLITAMRQGGLLYLEELNRVPEETLNVLITVLTEGEIAVPRLGTVHAGKDFRLIAAMNPFDAVGTARVSQAIADRMCRVVLGYQDRDGERAITSSVSGLAGRWVDLSVELTRATREHRDVRMGSSVRGAIDLSLVLTGLAELRGEPEPGLDTARDAAYAALSGRIRVTDGVDRTPESVIDELLASLWPADPAEDSPDAEKKADSPAADSSPPGFQPRSRPGREQAGRTQGRQQLAQQHPAFSEVSPELGELDADAFDAAVAEAPGAAGRRCSRTWPWPRTSSCGRRRAGWRAGCSSGSAASGPRGRAAPGGSARRPGWTATWTSTAPWTAGCPPRRGGPGPRTSSPAPGPRTGAPSA